jgi:DNA-binding FadR family transcriptional regulator
LNDILIKSWNAYWEKHTALGPSDFVAADAHESDMYHYQILDAIRKHDPEAARHAMSQMLTHWSRMYGEHDVAQPAA